MMLSIKLLQKANVIYKQIQILQIQTPTLNQLETSGSSAEHVCSNEHDGGRSQDL